MIMMEFRWNCWFSDAGTDGFSMRFSSTVGLVHFDSKKLDVDLVFAS